MSLFKYFKKVNTDSTLPDVSGSLSTILPSTAIRLANKEATKALEKITDQGSSAASHTACGQYESFTCIKKATIAKYALEHGVNKAIRKLECQFPKKSWKNLQFATRLSSISNSWSV